MTTLQEACAKALEAWQTSCYGKDEHQIAMVLAMTDLYTALAQQGEQDNKCPSCGHEQRSIEYTCNNCGRGVEVEYTAAPAPQPAQTKQVLENLEQLTAPQPAQDALQDIAMYIGVGGYNGATTEQLAQRIRGEFDRLTALQSAQPVAPLTDEQMSKLYRQSALKKDVIIVRSDWERGVRDCEAAHGIKEAK